MRLLGSLAKMLHPRGASSPHPPSDPRLAVLQKRSEIVADRATRVIPRTILDELTYADRVLLGLPDRRKTPR